MNDLWTALQKDSSPILLYGMGNGADKILSVCKRKGIEISGVFASDGFARGNLYRGMPVLSFREAKERFGDFRVLLSFASSRPEVLETISLVAGERTLYVPDVPVAGENLFDKDFLDAHMQDFKRAREILEDDLSKDVFDTVISCKLYGELHFFDRNLSTEEEDFNTILHPGDYRICGDFGAYSGDTAKDLARRCPLLQQILSVEPDAKTFLRLQKTPPGFRSFRSTPLSGTRRKRSSLLPAATGAPALTPPEKSRRKCRASAATGCLKSCTPTISNLMWRAPNSVPFRDSPGRFSGTSPTC